jgi:Domain of unknown function (DUF4398)
MKREQFWSMLVIAAGLVLLSAVLEGCGILPERNLRLEEARSIYAAAQRDPEGASLGAAKLQQAGELLEKATEVWGSRDDPALVDHLAYLAKQHVAISREVVKMKVAGLAIARSQTAQTGRDLVPFNAGTMNSDVSLSVVATRNVSETAH